MKQEEHLFAAADAVLDATPVDWEEAEKSLPEGRPREVLHALHILSQIADVHRSVDETARRSLRPRAPAPHRWGDLEILESLGEGSTAEVFRAREPKFEREVALKLYYPGRESTDLLREGRHLAQVKHPNVAVVFGAADHDGRAGIWMELIAGKTLSEIVTEDGPFRAEEAALLCIDVCRALAAIHSLGLVHRDVKAANVVREVGGRVVLMDFGIVHEVNSADDPSRRLVGTPLYLAPEIFDGQEARARTDLYSVGVLAYYLVSGTFPVTGVDLANLRRAHREGKRRPLRDVRPDVPDRFAAIVDRATAAEPEARYRSAGEVEQALRTVAGLPARPTAGRKLVFAIAAGVLALALGWIVDVPARMNALWGGPAYEANVAPGELVEPVELIAVLPFGNLSKDPSESYLARAVPIELTTKLARIGALKVVPWTVMESLAHTDVASLKEIAARTGADAVLEGAVQRAPEMAGQEASLQIHLQLFDARSGHLIWAETLGAELSNFPEVSGNVAQEIAARVHVKLSRREQRRLSSAHASSAQAVEYYLRGLEEEYRSPRAVEYYQLAVEEDPDFAEAYVRLARSYALLSGFQGQLTSSEAYASASKAAERALALDGELGEAWAARAWARYALLYDFRGAEEDFQRAFEFSPSSGTVHKWYSNLLTSTGRHEQAIEHAKIGVERSPLSAAARRTLGWAFYFARRYDEAIATLEATLERDPDYVPARTLLGRAYAQVGRYDEAIAELERTQDDWKDMLAQVYGAAGRVEDAKRALGEWIAAHPEAPRRPYEIALAYAMMGNEDAAMDWLRRSYEERIGSFCHLKTDPRLDSIRHLDEFQELLEIMDFPTYEESPAQ